MLALERNPTYASSYWGRGNAYYHLNNYPEAIADYREYERLTGSLEQVMTDRIAEMQASP